MRLGIDIDDVLYPWFDIAHAACVDAGITGGVAPSTWSPHEEYGCSLQDWLTVMAEATLDGRLYRGKPIRGAIPALHNLHAAGHTVHLVTARGFMQHGHAIREQTLRWLDEWQVPHDSLTFSKDKTVMRVDWFADDSVRNIADLNAAGIPACLITAPHNLTSPHPTRRESIAAFAADIVEGHLA